MNLDFAGSKQSLEEPQDILESIRDALNDAKSDVKDEIASNSNGKM